MTKQELAAFLESYRETMIDHVLTHLCRCLTLEEIAMHEAGVLDWQDPRVKWAVGD